MIWLYALGTLAAAGAINRLRGHGISGSKWYASGAFGLVAGLLFWDWRWGLAAGLCFLFWGAFSWGRWFDLGRLPEDHNREGQKKSTFDSTIEMMAFDSDYVALWIRHAFGIAPAAGLLAWWCDHVFWLLVIPIFATLVVLCYEIGWRVTKSKVIEVAEVLAGLVWGGLLLAAWNWC